MMEDRGAAGYKGSEHGMAGSKPKYDGGLAFPFFEERVMNTPEWGMSLRDYFAAKAMQGLSANAGVNGFDFVQLAEMAYEQADAMLAERAK